MGRNSEKLECDLVMRGGITSGILYPRAIAKLAETYNFRSIGGTSAGAIAAAATAAAQFGANNGENRLQTIYELPKKLAELRDDKSTLERLFQPQPGTSRLFSLLMSGLEREGTFKKILRIVTTGLANYWCYSVAGAAVTLIPLLWVASASGLSGVPRAVMIIAALILGLLTAILGVALGVFCDVRKRLPQNRYGLETARLVDWTTGWTTDDQTFDRNSNPGRSPRPKPGLRMMPPGANDPRADRGV